MGERQDGPIRADVIDWASLAVVAVLLVLAGLGVTGPLRTALALIFLTFVPGWAVVTNWALAARASPVALSVLLSLSICTGVATTTLWLHLWHPVVLLYILALSSCVGIVSGHRRRARRTALDPGGDDRPGAS